MTTPPPPPQISPDGKFYWDGQAWLPMPTAAGPAAAPSDTADQPVAYEPGWAAKGAYGPVNRALRCPHCGKTGAVHAKKGKQKKGVSGGKATAAVLTMGVSMLGTGLSRKEQVWETFCGNCRMSGVTSR